MKTKAGLQGTRKEDDLRLAINGEDVPEVLSALDSLTSDDRTDTLTELVVRLLTETQTKVIRNAAAIALADMQAGSAVKAIVSVLHRPETQKSRGTLFYALARMGGAIDLDIVADTVVNSSFEAAEACLDALEQRRVVPGMKVRGEILQKLRVAARAACSTERRKMIENAVELIESLPGNLPGPMP